jgi:hypothetical protein
MPDQINQIDADQNREIALLKQKIEDTVKDFHDLRGRVRLLEKWVWGAGAVIAAVIVIAGIAANAQEVTDGSHDATKQEVLLQLSSH